MLYVIPIEPLEERYSAQWLKWTRKFLKETERWYPDFNYTIINPKAYDKIKKGSFLDVVNTNVYKNKQMQEILKLFQQDKIKDGDVFWFHDMWFPGLEMLAYIRDAAKIKIKIFGMLHAGTYDEYDFTAKVGMTPWAKPLEQSWISLVDGVFVATEFHKKLIMEGDRLRGHSSEKIIVTGFPLYHDRRMPKLDHEYIKEDIIVFPHRLDDEKQPHLFYELECYMKEHYAWAKNYRFIRTKDVCNTKKEYYELLTKARYAVSFALQETWGIAMLESVLCNCVPIMPNRLAYPEAHGHTLLFDGTVKGAAKMINEIEIERQERIINNWDCDDAESNLFDYKQRLLQKGDNAFCYMMRHMLRK